jgi:glycosyltransferase involved in cell wall biosynthesis
MSSVGSLNRLRIAMLAPLWFGVGPGSGGGREVFLHTFTEELVRRGHRVTLFASGDSVTNAELRPICERNLVELMTRHEAFESDHYANAGMAEAIKESESFDIIHSHLGCAWVPWGMLCRTPFLHSTHSPSTKDDDWVLARYPDAPVTAVSHNQVKAIRESRRRSIRVIPNSCDFDSYRASFEPGRYLVFLGRMAEQKSPLDAIRTAKAVGLPIVLAGAPLTKKEESYFDTVVRPHLDGERVKYIGPVSHQQKNELLKNASALLFPIQEDEAFGLVMIEAMACGTPVIACDLGAVREVVDWGVTGFYAESAGGLAQLVESALALDRRTVREHARQRFNHEVMVDRYLQVYEQILDRAGVPPGEGALREALA